MIKNVILKLVGQYSYFIWLSILIIFTISSTYFYDINKKNQINSLKKALKNIYLSNSIKKITSELKPRYINIEYNVKQGDTYETIIKGLDIPNIEKNIFLKTVTKNKNIDILKLNQKILFKIDKKDNIKIINFIIEIDKKKIFYFKEAMMKLTFQKL